MTRARVWATAAFLLGVVVSVAANVAHTYYVPGASGRPPLGAQLAAAFYPLALLLVVEILARVPWPRSLGWAFARYGGTAVVALVAALVSYRHMAALLDAYGEDVLTSRIGPLAVDGLMVVASFALLALGRPSGNQDAPDVLPVAEAEALPDGYALWDDVEPEPEPPALAWWPLPQLPAGDQADEDEREDEAAPDPTSPVPGVPGDVIERAVELFRDDIEAGRVPTYRSVKDSLNVGQKRARRVREYMAVLASSPR
ncbi:DUF2637 domain-containing protein [Actinomadura fibrosa]|uniref:DUF2637 domain-containing protein n=1 Tax=Actinomadura fibrosa TaxID=111802 RepID=A0ABW2XM47_9ACTN|nr:DUF2637 domain-containing protein [Actinomadura fibrosa]